MKIYKTDPSAYHVQAGDRRFPVRDGYFMVPDSFDPELLPGFEAASDAPTHVVAELRDLGSVALDPDGGEVPVEASGTADEQLKAAHAALDESQQQIAKLVDRVNELEEELAARDASDRGDGGVEKTLEQRIDEVDGHDAANALAAELGVEGFTAKKPSVEAKRQALRERAAVLAEAAE